MRSPIIQVHNRLSLTGHLHQRNSAHPARNPSKNRGLSCVLPPSPASTNVPESRKEPPVMSQDPRITEASDAAHQDLETRPTEEILGTLLGGQSRAIAAVDRVLPALAAAVEAAADRLGGGNGRLVYVGAGTSGRLGLLDGVELLPTFGWPEDRLATLLAGGDVAFLRAVEGAEDDVEAARQDIENANTSGGDVVLSIAASGTTPYTLEATRAARESGALTIALANNPDGPLLAAAEHGILLDTGPEVLAGSTRLAAGTAQKAALNLFSTALMARLHKIYKGLMVDMVATNEKLRDRAVRMVASLTEPGGTDAARAALEATGYRIKPALLIAGAGLSLKEAEALLEQVGGNLHDASKALIL